MKWMFCLLIFATTATTTAEAQIKTVEKFVKQYPELDKYFIYQSTLRMINQEGNEDFNKLIKDIRKINVYVSEDSGEISLERYQAMVDDLFEEKFEILVNAKYQGTTWVNMMSRELNGRSYYVLTVRDDDSFALMEMDGDLDLQYINAIEKMNFDELVGMFAQKKGN